MTAPRCCQIMRSQLTRAESDVRGCVRHLLRNPDSARAQAKLVLAQANLAKHRQRHAEHEAEHAAGRATESPYPLGSVQCAGTTRFGVRCTRHSGSAATADRDWYCTWHTDQRP